MDDLEQINAGFDHLPNLIYVNIPIILETCELICRTSSIC